MTIPQDRLQNSTPFAQYTDDMPSPSIELSADESSLYAAELKWMMDDQESISHCERAFANNPVGTILLLSYFSICQTIN